MSDYCELKVLEHVLRNTAFTSPAAVYLALHTGDPGEAGTSFEITPQQRLQMTFAAAAAGAISISAAIEFVNLTTNTITHVSIWDSATAGNCLWAGALAASRAVTTGDNLRITALTVSLD
jgi:hypothetical protein